MESIDPVWLFGGIALIGGILLGGLLLRLLNPAAGDFAKLRVHDSIFVPMAKWSMLLTGNYRCIQREQMISIRDAVHSDLAESARIYGWVADVCVALGANRDDLVPFEKYANAAKGLLKPSSAARALEAGATHIERVDRLVASIARQHGMVDPAVDGIIETVEFHLHKNRSRSAS